MKKVFALHDKFTEEVIGHVIIDDSQTDALREAWTVYHRIHNSNTTEANLYNFEQQYGKTVGFEVIDFIQL